MPCHQRRKRASWQQLEGNGGEGVGGQKRRADEARVSPTLASRARMRID